LVAVIDDDEEMRLALESLFAYAGYVVEAYPSALAFLDDRPTVHRTAIVTDHQMPGMSGLELVRGLKALGCEAPVFVITAFTTEAIRSAADKLGVTALLEKPFQPGMLLDLVAKAAH
jgi:FixJ family two-component response regulator